MKLHMALEVILRLDVAQENRSLSPAELDLRAKLKKRVLGWRSLRGQEVGKPRVSPILSWETPTLNIFTEELTLEEGRTTSKDYEMIKAGRSHMPKK